MARFSIVVALARSAPLPGSSTPPWMYLSTSKLIAPNTKHTELRMLNVAQKLIALALVLAAIAVANPFNDNLNKRWDCCREGDEPCCGDKH
ncbi:hypothetical protein H4Q26_017596 [Puccinia striiformis f. sp. tritici PST-130]|nr:hypothetical protein H4Q26_017596 [Puccinia striiformis f. sp. tritici PST-130]